MYSNHGTFYVTDFNIAPTEKKDSIVTFNLLFESENGITDSVACKLLVEDTADMSITEIESNAMKRLAWMGQQATEHIG